MLGKVPAQTTHHYSWLGRRWEGLSLGRICMDLKSWMGLVEILVKVIRSEKLPCWTCVAVFWNQARLTDSLSSSRSDCVSTKIHSLPEAETMSLCGVCSLELSQQ